jgi:hypothetical protein
MTLMLWTPYIALTHKIQLNAVISTFAIELIVTHLLTRILWVGILKYMTNDLQGTLFFIILRESYALRTKYRA